MTSMPASRSARATIFTPRSWPSSPTLAISTRMGAVMAANCTVLPSAHPMATDPNFFGDLAWVIVAAVAGGALAWLARQPLILGYVVGGILVGRFTPGPTVSAAHPPRPREDRQLARRGPRRRRDDRSAARARRGGDGAAPRGGDRVRQGGARARPRVIPGRARRPGAHASRGAHAQRRAVPARRP